MDEIEAKNNEALEKKDETSVNETEKVEENVSEVKENISEEKEQDDNQSETAESDTSNAENDISKSLENAGETPVEPEKPAIETREHPKFGRKVFFLNPPMSITSYVMDSLKEEQLEVYSIYDYRVAKQVLEFNPDSICFIFIDDELPLRGWYNFIQSFEDNEKLKSIFLGAISARIRPKDRENFLMNLKLPCGFVSLSGNINEVYQNLSGILKINGAKGNRQYVKLDCKDDLVVTGYFAEKLRLYQFIVSNMSTAGIAIKMPVSQGYNFVKNSVIDNICINIGKKTAVCAGLIFDVRIIDNVATAIILFTKQTPNDQRKSIRNFIFEKLQERFDLIQNNLNPDITNYVSDVPVTNGEVPNEKLDSPEGDVVLNQVEEAEEVKENKEADNKSDNKEDDKVESETKEESKVIPNP